MDFSEKASVINPVKKANPISRHFFMWVFPLFRKGYQSDLTADDLYDPRQSDVSSTLGDKLEEAWFKELEKASHKSGTKPRLRNALWACFGKYYAAIFILYFITECILRVAQPLFIRELVRSFSEHSDVSEGGQYGLACGVIVSTFMITMFFHPSFHGGFITAMRCRISCSSIIYRKALRLSKASQGSTTVGQITNILFDLNLLFLPYFIMGPIQFLIFVYFLWDEFGTSSLAGFGVVILMSVVQYWNGTLSTEFRRKIAVKTDERSRTMNEIIVAIRVIKMYAWEKPFTNLINKLRKLEMSVIRKRSYLRGIYLSVYSSALKFLPFLTFLVFTLATDEDLTPDKVFFTVAVYNVIIQNTMYFIPSAASGIGEIMVSLKRLETFLLLEEKGESMSKNYVRIDTVGSPFPIDLGPGESPRVCLNSATASWTGDKNHLQDIQMDVSGDKVVVIVGPVGSGKTTLLHALLGELPIQSGRCAIHGRIAYASQEPWIFAATVRQNILFGRPFHQEKYAEVTAAAALLDDFKQLSHGDMTVVGDRGASLSGGQKARINLARALYQEAEIYIMDDPLSAVDARVSRHLFEKCMKTFLKGKLRILVTHQLQYLSQADHILVFSDGKIHSQGTFDQLVEQGVDFVSLLASDSLDDAKNRKVSVVAKEEEHVEKPKENLKKQDLGEKMATGALNSQVYWEYFKIGNSPIGLFLLISICASAQVAISATEFWMSFWSNAEAKERDEAETGGYDNYLGQTTYLSIYGGLVALVLVLNFLRAVGWFTYSARISVNMHDKMFSSIVRSPTKFFDDNPPGRVMNRFTKDLGHMDELLPPVFFETTIILLQMAGVLAIVIVANWVIAIPAVVVIVVLILLRQFYIRTARAVKRIEGMSKSPVFTHAAATFQGLTTIRSANIEKILIQQFDGFQDAHTSAWYLFLVTIRCFGVWVEMVAVLFLGVIAFSFLILQNSSQQSGNVGLAITSAMNLTTWVQFALRQSAEVANLMTSVERTLEYVGLPSEAKLESKPDKKPPSDWPKNGEILFKDVHLAYSGTPVLRNLNFTIGAKAKIGIVGRTGAGKSSIIQALFRMVEPTGDIFIDGVKVNDIGLHDLRSRISIIPQDPVLFCGTMRYNLDPFSMFEDGDLWRVLEEVHLKDAIPDLSFKVSDGGDNFSVCLARAILRENRIILMDEATANCDPLTDNFIQETIRTRFAECTIITIAHRLNSVMDCDRILVLDRGVIMEYDHPWKLLQNENGILSSLVKTTGKASSALLRDAAELSYNKRNSKQT
ncbi:Multidrug resistance-associated protein 4 [Folsomia candida]|uniref:Multidrug resistance-associated protein 4 n=1 Tax=Folsomia candida TaxID=158441 RepID=A0A226ERL0_FOLCA|nr:Multidrug resistance-associated protein 4 [Folsomia candida]